MTNGLIFMKDTAPVKALIDVPDGQPVDALIFEDENGVPIHSSQPPKPQMPDIAKAFPALQDTKDFSNLEVQFSPGQIYVKTPDKDGTVAVTAIDTDGYTLKEFTTAFQNFKVVLNNVSRPAPFKKGLVVDKQFHKMFCLADCGRSSWATNFEIILKSRHVHRNFQGKEVARYVEVQIITENGQQSGFTVPDREFQNLFPYLKKLMPEIIINPEIRSIGQLLSNYYSQAG